MTHQPAPGANEVPEVTLARLESLVAKAVQTQTHLADLVTRLEESQVGLTAGMREIAEEIAEMKVQDDELDAIYTRLDAIEDVIMSLHPEVGLGGENGQEERPG